MDPSSGGNSNGCARSSNPRATRCAGTSPRPYRCSNNRQTVRLRRITMRLLHTMLRVGNLDRALMFYTDILGMRLLRKKDYPDGRFTLAFVGYQDEDE